MPAPDDNVTSALERCPLCDYDLSGLPREHICPECGFEYDKETIVLPCWVTKEGQKNWRQRAVNSAVVIGGVFLFIVCAGVLGPSQPALVAGFFIAMLVLIVTATLLSKLIFPKPSRSDWVLTISPSGLGFRIRMTGRSSVTPWSEFTSVRVSKAGRHVHRLKLRRCRTGKLPKVPLSVIFETDKSNPATLDREIAQYLRHPRDDGEDAESKPDGRS